jgi:hypothetical protein
MSAAGPLALSWNSSGTGSRTPGTGAVKRPASCASSVNGGRASSVASPW